MPHSDLLQEYWTDKRTAVVVTAGPTLIDQLLDDLDLPHESPVSVSNCRLALALWGEQLSTYLAWRTSLDAARRGSGATVTR